MKKLNSVFVEVGRNHNEFHVGDIIRVKEDSGVYTFKEVSLVDSDEDVFFYLNHEIDIVTFAENRLDTETEVAT